MSVAIRTLSAQDAEILARTIETGVVSNGCVERYDLRWRSDALRTWEVTQRSLGRKPVVNIRIDELDLAIVYVEPLDGSRDVFKAISTLPRYTHWLSLYEHRKLKQKMRELRLRDRLVQMEDEEAFNLRISYYAELGRAEDPIAYRRLVGFRDKLAALRTQETGHSSSVPPSLAIPRHVDSAPDVPRKPRVARNTEDRDEASLDLLPDLKPPSTQPESPLPPERPLAMDVSPSPLPRIQIKRKPL